MNTNVINFLMMLPTLCIIKVALQLTSSKADILHKNMQSILWRFFRSIK